MKLSDDDAELGLDGLVDPAHLSIVFQPIVDLAHERIFAFEALARCTTPGLESPEHLFSRAEQQHKTGVLGRVLRRLIFAAKVDVPLFVNVHPHELTEPWLLRDDDPIFTHTQRVYLEVTETMPLNGFEECRDTLNELRARGGIQFVVDDLGAGFSNLRRISDLAPAVVKIDRNLIVGLPESQRQQRLLKGIVRLCEDLGAKVVAEGIESAAEFSAARDAGAHFGQGFLWAQPAFPVPNARRMP